MRQQLAVLLALAGTAYADGKPKPIDVKATIDKLDVFRDDTGMLLVVPRPGELDKDADAWLFYGDGKTLYQQRIIGSGASGDQRSWVVWSPRAKGLQGASLELDPSGADVKCNAGVDKHQKLVPVAPDKARALLNKATFLPPLWTRSAKFLARDDDGVYFFVDAADEEHGGKDYRVYSGKKGAMKQLAMTNVVSDSAGEIYATKLGELKVVSGTDGKAYWKRGEKKAELIVLPLYENKYLMYRELGIYGTLGVVCDNN